MLKVQDKTGMEPIMIRWKCSLCNIQLPDDKDAEIRKHKHKQFHVDESVGTTNIQRNWTFGNAQFELVEQ